MSDELVSLSAVNVTRKAGESILSQPLTPNVDSEMQVSLRIDTPSGVLIRSFRTQDPTGVDAFTLVLAGGLVFEPAVTYLLSGPGMKVGRSYTAELTEGGIVANFSMSQVSEVVAKRVLNEEALLLDKILEQAKLTNERLAVLVLHAEFATGEISP